MANQLTVKFVENAKPAATRKEHPDGGNQGVIGLRLTVHPSGGKSWVFRYRFPKGGPNKKLTLGGWPRYSLAEARDWARKLDFELKSGRDPAAPKIAGKTIEDIARSFLERHAIPNTRPKSYHETARILGFRVCPDGSLSLTGSGIVKAWQGRTIESIGGHDVIDLIDGIAAEAPVSANRTLSALKTLFTWAVSRKLLGVSPCAGIKPPAKEKPRQRVLKPHELAAVWRAVGRLGSPADDAYRLLVLSGQRRSQVSNARLEDFDFDALVPVDDKLVKMGLWTIRPDSEGSKSGMPHVLPITREIEEIVRRCRHKQGYLFSADGGATPLSMRGGELKGKLDALIAEDGVTLAPWTTHDLRRTMRTGISALAVPEGDVVRELVIGHVRQGISATYDVETYLPQKKICLELWAARVAAIVAPDGGKVVPMVPRTAKAGA